MTAKNWGYLILFFAFGLQWFCLDQLNEAVDAVDNAGVEYIHSKMASESFFTRFLITGSNVWLRESKYA